MGGSVTQRELGAAADAGDLPQVRQAGAILWPPARRFSERLAGIGRRYDWLDDFRPMPRPLGGCAQAANALC